MLQALLCLVCAIGLETESDSDPQDLSPVTDEVAEILTKWEAASRITKTCKIEFNRIVYNLVFQAESRSEGELLCQMPHDVRLILRPEPLPKNAMARPGPNGPFRLELDLAEQWIWSAIHVTATNDDDKTFVSYLTENNGRSTPEIGEVDGDYCSELVESDQSQSLAERIRIAFTRMRHPDFVFPFLLSIKGDKLRSLWTFRVLKREEEKIFLVVTPRTRLLKQFYSECRVILDATSWRTLAIKTCDSSKSVEVVYTVKHRDLNPELPVDTFNPDLESIGYKNHSEDRASLKKSPAKQPED